jgi:dipeptidase
MQPLNYPCSRPRHAGLCLPRRSPVHTAITAAASALLLLLLLLLAAAPRHVAAQCTTILVGSGATVDGSMIMARNADAGEAIKPAGLLHHPAPGKPVHFRSNINAFAADLPADALAYTASPSFFTMAPGSHNPSFECCGVNAAGVSVTATETILPSAKALAADPLDEERGLGEDGIVSVLLPVARSAREGVELLGAMVEERAASEGYGVALMDQRDLWWAVGPRGLLLHLHTFASVKE